ncbi:MAG: 3-oxoacyl-[acyl-carrier protein] reductase, partial [uncultured Acidimicrobiales bacterium]
ARPRPGRERAGRRRVAGGQGGAPASRPAPRRGPGPRDEGAGLHGSGDRGALRPGRCRGRRRPAHPDRAGGSERGGRRRRSRRRAGGEPRCTRSTGSGARDRRPGLARRLRRARAPAHAAGPSRPAADARPGSGEGGRRDQRHAAPARRAGHRLRHRSWRPARLRPARRRGGGRSGGERQRDRAELRREPRLLPARSTRRPPHAGMGGGGEPVGSAGRPLGVGRARPVPVRARQRLPPRPGHPLRRGVGGQRL